MTLFDMFSNMESVYKDFANYLDKAIEDNKIQVNINGQPLQSEDNCKKSDADSPCTNPHLDTKSDTVSSTADYSDDEEGSLLFEHLTRDVVKMANDNEYYYLKKHCNGSVTTEEVALVFENDHEDGYYTPGITEEQLLLVLLHRNKNNEVRSKKIIELLSTYNEATS